MFKYGYSVLIINIEQGYKLHVFYFFMFHSNIFIMRATLISDHETFKLKRYKKQH